MLEAVPFSALGSKEGHRAATRPAIGIPILGTCFWVCAFPLLKDPLGLNRYLIASRSPPGQDSYRILIVVVVVVVLVVVGVVFFRTLLQSVWDFCLEAFFLISGAFWMHFCHFGTPFGVMFATSGLLLNTLAVFLG